MSVPEPVPPNFEPVSSGRALQIIDFDEENNLICKEEAVQEILQNASSRPVAVISIVGANREGKSFFLSQILQFLRAKSGQQTKLDGPIFESRGGCTRQTVGVWMWSVPFTIRSSEDEEFDVVLMDTQGFFDDHTNQREWSIIVALSLLTSSCLFYNVMKDVKEDSLQTLATFLSHGILMAAQQQQPLSSSHLPEDVTEQPPVTNSSGCNLFQNLIFLVRDWQNPSDFPYGPSGGQLFITEKIKVKPHHNDTHKLLRQQLLTNFDQIQCFLLPHPGPNVVNCDMTLNDLDPAFVQSMDQCITNLFENPTSISIKRLIGWPLSYRPTLPDLLNLLQLYIGQCNNEQNDLLKPESLFEVTIRSFNAAVVNKCVQEYKSEMAANIRLHCGKCYFDEVFTTIEKSVRAGVFKLFENDFQKMNSHHHIDTNSNQTEEYKTERGNLFKKLDPIFEEYRLKNSAARAQFLIETGKETLREYKAVMKTNVGFIDFVSEEEFEYFSAQAESKAMAYFKLACEHQGLKSNLIFHCNSESESENSESSNREIPVESMNQEICSLMEKLGREKKEFEQINQLRIKQAEKELDQAVGSKLTQYRNEIELKLFDKFFIEENLLLWIHKDVRHQILTKFAAEEMIGERKCDMAKKLLEHAQKNLTKAIDSEFTSIERNVAGRNQKLKLQGSQIVLDGVRMYEVLVGEYKGVDVEEFEKNHAEVTTKVIDHLDRVFGRGGQEVRDKFVENFQVEVGTIRKLAMEQLSERKVKKKKQTILKTAAAVGLAGAGIAGIVVGGVVALPLLAGAGAAAAIVPFAAGTAATAGGVLIPSAIAAGVGAGAVVGTAAGVGYKIAKDKSEDNEANDENSSEADDSMKIFDDSEESEKFGQEFQLKLEMKEDEVSTRENLTNEVREILI